MAIIRSEEDTDVKLLQMKLGLDGVQHQSTKTIGNIVNGITDEALFNGINAIIGLLAQAPSAVIRVEECSLSQQ